MSLSTYDKIKEQLARFSQSPDVWKFVTAYAHSTRKQYPESRRKIAQMSDDEFRGVVARLNIESKEE